MQKNPIRYPYAPLLSCIGTAALLLMVIVSCRKSTAPVSEEITVATAAFPSTFNFNCTEGPVYQDSILCAKWMGPNKDHIVKPQNAPPAGKYYAWPAGLKIDVNTGAINLTQSESGVQYIIGYVKDGAADTCHIRIVVAGIHYLDNIYVLSNNDTLALPYFNANPSTQAPCDASDDNDYPGNGNGNGNGQGNDRCEFDDGEDDDNGNGALDEPPPGQQANDFNVRVRTKSGVINLKKSLADGAFGQNPQNGDSSQVTIYYRLADCSMKALRRIKVKLVYYDSASNVPPALLAEVIDRKDNFTNGRVITKQGAPRPPLIIVTRQQ